MACSGCQRRREALKRMLNQRRSQHASDAKGSRHGTRAVSASQFADKVRPRDADTK